MFCTRTHSCTCAKDAKIMRSRDVGCNTKELPQAHLTSRLQYSFDLNNTQATVCSQIKEILTQVIRCKSSRKLITRNILPGTVTRFTNKSVFSRLLRIKPKIESNLKLLLVSAWRM